MPFLQLVFVSFTNVSALNHYHSIAKKRNNAIFCLKCWFHISNLEFIARKNQSGICNFGTSAKSMSDDWAETFDAEMTTTRTMLLAHWSNLKNRESVDIIQVLNKIWLSSARYDDFVLFWNGQYSIFHSHKRGSGRVYMPTTKVLR
jgi:hypothetical protein